MKHYNQTHANFCSKFLNNVSPHEVHSDNDNNIDMFLKFENAYWDKFEILSIMITAFSYDLDDLYLHQQNI